MQFNSLIARFLLLSAAGLAAAISIPVSAQEAGSEPVVKKVAVAKRGDQQTLQSDHSAVFVTAVPHRNMLQNPPPAVTTETVSMGRSATFGGSPYTVGPVITPTTTFPEAEEHIAVDPNVSSSLVAVISDFSRPLDGFSGVNTTKFASPTDNGTSWIEGFVPQGRDGRPTTSDGLAWDANSDPVVARDRLGINDTLLQLESDLNRGSPSPKRLDPLLDQISSDPKFVEIARQRARSLADRLRRRG